MLTVNTEPPYPHFFHQVQVANIALLQVSGDADISYVGFGPADLTPAPPVGFNLTFICPAGQVFDHDWFATPFLMMTCQENGIFDDLQVLHNSHERLVSGTKMFISLVQLSKLR